MSRPYHKKPFSVAFLSAPLLAFALVAPSTVSAIPLIDGLGGPAGYGELAMLPNDDGSSNQLNLPFEVNFFGNTYNSFFINTNGNITFNAPVRSYTPSPFPISNQPMIAPYWADVDTRCSTCGSVYVAAPNEDTTVVTWNDVGYYYQDSSRTNNFQLVLRNQNAGNFDVEFRYDRLEWTTGDASGGSGGLGGTPAQAGYDAGDGTNYFALPGSFTAAVLNLQDTSNVSTSTPGLWSFAIREGALPGETPDNPLMPVITNEGFVFDFNVDLNETVFVDPLVAIGYDYIVNSGPNFASVVLPTGIGDNLYDLWLFNTALGAFVDSGVDITGGDIYNFGSGGVDRFRILGIETSALLDPTDPTAFVTGLTFTAAGQVNMNQNPISIDTGTSSVPEPGTLLLLGSGLLGLGAAKRARRQ